MTPRQRFYLRLVAVAIVAGASALKAYLPGLSWEDGADIVASMVVAAGAYAGIGAATPLEPSVGRQPQPPPAPPTTLSPNP